MHDDISHGQRPSECLHAKGAPDCGTTIIRWGIEAESRLS